MALIAEIPSAQPISQARSERMRMWRSTERASLAKKPSMRLSHDPCVGLNVKVKRPMGCAASQLVVSRETRSARCVSVPVVVEFSGGPAV